jgi:hypothetical protein
MLLNTRQDEEGNGAATVSNDGQRVGRLVMRGKTCEVKAAEPKDASRYARCGYQNTGYGVASPNRIHGDKTYGSHGAERPVNSPHMGAYHDPHYMSGHGQHYSMMSPPYYPTYHHPGIYHASGGYPVGPVYPTMGNATGVVPMPGGDTNQPVVPPQTTVFPQLVASQVDATQYPYIDPYHHEVDTGYPYTYGHPHVHSTYQLQAGAYVYAKGQHFAGAYPVPVPSSSVMHPAAPGIPSKDDK